MSDSLIFGLSLLIIAVIIVVVIVVYKSQNHSDVSTTTTTLPSTATTTLPSTATTTTTLPSTATTTLPSTTSSITSEVTNKSSHQIKYYISDKPNVKYLDVLASFFNNPLHRILWNDHDTITLKPGSSIIFYLIDDVFKYQPIYGGTLSYNAEALPPKLCLNARIVLTKAKGEVYVCD